MVHRTTTSASAPIGHHAAEHASTMQFYILMIDHGKGPQRPIGLEAVVQPELTRRDIVEQVRDIIKEGRHEIAFVKFVDGNFIDDCTAEMFAEAFAMELA